MTREAPRSHWEASLPDDDRQRLAAAWQAFRCCADCRYWSGDDEGDGEGVCLEPGLSRCGSFMTPEDYTCGEFAPLVTTDPTP